MDNRRIWDRKPVNIKSKYRFIDVATYRSCQIVDLHHMGLSIKTEDFLEVNKEIRLVFSIPVQGEIYLSGVVCWSKMDKNEGFVSGIKFNVWGQDAEESITKLYSVCCSL